MVKPTVPGGKRAGLWQSILLVFLFALAVFILFKSPAFDVKKIEVRGNRQLSEEKIINTSGLHTGVNIFKINLKEARFNLSTLPILKNIRLERDLPDKIIITVEERNPVALLPAENGFIEVDREQVYIRKSQAVKEDLPVITGVNIASAGPGEVVKGKGLKIVLQVIEELPEELVSRLSEVHYQDDGSLVLYTLGGVQCRMGSPKEVASKGSVFLQVLRELEEKNKEIEYIDLSFIGSPVVKYKE